MASTIIDSAVRLLLPDGKPARGIFPGLAADLDTPVYAACSFSPSSSADNARQNVSCPVVPSGGAQDRLSQCQVSKCAVLRAEMDVETSKAQGSSESWWSYSVRDAIAAGARLNDCTLTHCITEFWAAHGSLCVSLDAPVLRNTGVTLPQLPATAPESLRQLHQDHIASRQNPLSRNATSTAAADTLKLGICAPVPPIGIRCEPAQVSSEGIFQGSIGIPQIDPMPRSVILSTALPQGSAWPRVVEGNDPLAPARHFQAMPSDLKATSARASVAMNLMTLTMCNDTKLIVPAKGAGEACQKTSECRFGVCQQGHGAPSRTCLPIVPVAIPTQGATATINLAVNFNSGPGSAPPMATTSGPPWGGSFSPSPGSPGGPMFALLFLVLGLSFMMLLVGCARRTSQAKPTQGEARLLFASEVGGGAAAAGRAGTQRGSGAIELAPRTPTAPRRTAPSPTAGRAQRPIDPDLDEPLPRYVP